MFSFTIHQRELNSQRLTLANWTWICSASSTDLTPRTTTSFLFFSSPGFQSRENWGGSKHKSRSFFLKLDMSRLELSGSRQTPFGSMPHFILAALLSQVRLDLAQLVSHRLLEPAAVKWSPTERRLPQKNGPRIMLQPPADLQPRGLLQYVSELPH